MEGISIRYSCVCIARGFSLIELLITISVLSVLLFIAVPSLSNLITSTKVSSSKSAVVGMLARARTEAVSKRQRVGLCRTENSIDCAGYRRLGSQEWKKAILFLDSNYNNTFDNDEFLLGLFDLEVEGLSLVWNRGDLLFYDPDGTTRGGSFGSFKVKYSEIDKAAIILSLTGRYRVATY